MVDEPVTTPQLTPERVIEARTQSRADAMYDAWVDLLLTKIRNGTATASEQKNALDYFKECGLRPVIKEGTKTGDAAALLDKADQVSERTITLGNGVVLRRPA